MSAKELPSRPNLEFYKKQAKDLGKACKRGDPAAMRRVSEHHPRFEKLLEHERREAKFALADAQLVLAREHGFESWPKFAQAIAASAPADADAESRIWKAADAAVVSGEAEALESLLREHGDVLRGRRPRAEVPANGLSFSYSNGDARTIIAREHHCADWSAFFVLQAALSDPGSPTRQFEVTVDAIVAGDVEKLRHLLRQNPSLVRARSPRAHGGMLLHYLGANGIESFRQNTPKNAVEIATVLLDAGADVNAEAQMYGRDTAIGLVATSLHPLRAGVQERLLELLLERGAIVDGANSNIVDACLANGRVRAAELLDRRGAPLDLEGAAGIGRLDLVQTFFKPHGSLQPPATFQQLTDGFGWACEFGHTPVIEFLLDQGFDPRTPLKSHGQTGLHWAAFGGHAAAVRLLLARGAPVEVKDQTFGATPLGWAIYAWQNSPPEAARDSCAEVAAALLAAGAEPELDLELRTSLRADARMSAVFGSRLS